MRKAVTTLITATLVWLSCSLAMAQDAAPTPDPEAVPDQADSQAARTHFDPNEGFEEDGSITKRPMPPGLSNEERWRYVPEGKLVEGDILDRFFVSTFVIPVFFHQEDLGTGFGLNYSDINFRNTRRRELLNVGATYSTEGQQAYTAFWRRYLHHEEVEDGGVVFEERSFVAVGAGYTRTLSQRFFGFGPDSDEDAESNYSYEFGAASVVWQASFPAAGDPFVYTLGLTGTHRLLGAGKDDDLLQTKTLIPEDFEDARRVDALWVKGGVRYDILDSRRNPYSGLSVGFNADSAPLQTHGEWGVRFKLTSQFVLSVPSFWHDGGREDEENPPTDTIAVGGFVQSTAGSLPFYDLPSLGGRSTLRGYVANRWVDRAAWHVSFEYRFWPIARGIAITDTFRIERLGLALFADIGSVARRVEKFGGAGIKNSGGFSFRMALERTTLFRIDVAFSEEGTQVVVAYGLSF